MFVLKNVCIFAAWNNKTILKNEKRRIIQGIRFISKKGHDSKQPFYGRKQGSKPFQIYGFCKDLIIIQYDSYPKHYAVEKEVLLEGINKVINFELNVRLTSEYAEKIEFSNIQRQGTDNKTSALTKFYFSLHRGFLNAFKKSEKV